MLGLGTYKVTSLARGYALRVINPRSQTCYSCVNKDYARGGQPRAGVWHQGRNLHVVMLLRRIQKTSDKPILPSRYYVMIY